MIHYDWIRHGWFYYRWWAVLHLIHRIRAYPRYRRLRKAGASASVASWYSLQVVVGPSAYDKKYGRDPQKEYEEILRAYSDPADTTLQKFERAIRDFPVDEAPA